MRFVVDECTGPAVARHLRALDHQVFSVYESARGADDGQVLRIAVETQSILVTNDKDFGERVFGRGEPHMGVVLLRLADERASSKMAVLDALLASHAADLPGRFVVASERTVRFAR